MDLKSIRNSCFTLDRFENFVFRFPQIQDVLTPNMLYKKNGLLYIETEKITNAQISRLGEAYTVILKHSVVKPSDCALLIGIPTSKETFYNNPNSDYIKNFSWPKYQHDIIIPIYKFEKLIRQLGIKVIHKLTYSSFGKIFKDEKIDVFILFSHWKNKRIEFYNDFVPIDKIVNKIPNEFTGILDLCVCHPRELIKELRRKKPNCTLRSIDSIHQKEAEVTPSVWLTFYLALFKILEEKEITYIMAIHEVLEIYRKHSPRSILSY